MRGRTIKQAANYKLISTAIKSIFSCSSLSFTYFNLSRSRLDVGIHTAYHEQQNKQAWENPMEVSGWGKYPVSNSEVLTPVDSISLGKIVTTKKNRTPLIPRGAGRSYGDSSLSERILSSRFFDNFLELDVESKLLRCGAGIDLDSILQVCIPRGLFMPVLPGTKFVSVGGAIAADVHGKNHHRDGSFCDHLASFRIVLASGEMVSCSADENAELFHGTCGGMGLTGMIIDATLKLIPLENNAITQQSMVARNLEESFDLLNESDDSTYSVAWLDCLARGNSLGRSIIYLAEHSNSRSDERSRLEHKKRKGLNVPFNAPSFFLNKYTMKAFNNTYYRLKEKEKAELQMDYDRYFFPLDNIGNWNKLYGRQGFLQYQFVLPHESALSGIHKVLDTISSAGKGSFLTVLKKFGNANKNLLSFPKQGFTLTLDFKKEKSLFPLLNQLDEIVRDHSGRLYLAKDARMSEEMFKSGYENWQDFVELKQKYDPGNVFSSLQSDRIGLTESSSTLNSKARTITKSKSKTESRD